VQISVIRNKLPILLALVLTAVAAMPWLRSLELQRWSVLAGPTTVPPPSPMSVPGGNPVSPFPPGEGRGVTPVPSASAAPQTGSNVAARSSRRAETRTPSAQSSQITAQGLIDYAVMAVENQEFISAKIMEEGELFLHPLAGRGSYIEHREGPIPSIRLELTVQIDTVTTSLVQVCNGGTIWTYRKMPNGESLSKLDAVRAINALDQAASHMPPGGAFASPGLGGLGRLMRGLNATFDFKSPEADDFDGTPVWKLGGAWKAKVLARLMPEQNAVVAKGRPYDVTRLPARLPDSVTIYVRQGDYFPLRIDYCRSVPKSPPRCLLSFKLGDVSFRGPIDSSQFLFPPSSLEYTDRTDEFVRSLGM
jgi:hypothetical protein